MSENRRSDFRRIIVFDLFIFTAIFTGFFMVILVRSVRKSAINLEQELQQLEKKVGQLELDLNIPTNADNKTSKPANDALPTEMTVGGRAYDIIDVFKGNNDQFDNLVLVLGENVMGIRLGEDDGQYILKYQDEIPVQLRGKVTFVFLGWKVIDDQWNVNNHWGGDSPWYGSKSVACIDWSSWDQKRWNQYWCLLGGSLDNKVRFLRRKK